MLGLIQLLYVRLDELPITIVIREVGIFRNAKLLQ